MKAIKTWFTHKYTPLQQLLLIGFFARLFSVIFSKGFGWHDDHFLIIEVAQSWVDGYNFNHWLPKGSELNAVPQGHPILYTGIHYILFSFLKFIGLNDPQFKMLVIRLIHAIWSLLIVKYGYLIALRYADKKVAWYTGVFLALYWFMPFISVRNLSEFVCVPPILMAIYHLTKSITKRSDLLWAGLWLGLAISMRYQTIFILIGILIALLIQKTSIKSLLTIFFSFAIMFFFGTVLFDLIVWKRPFAELSEYIKYNLNNANNYGFDNPHMYFDLIFGLLIPPLSIILFCGYFYSWKKTQFIFWPVFIYLVFHTYFPNKQERFILTVLPLIIISGTIGMFQLYEKYGNRLNKKLIFFSRRFVVIINLILLPILSVSYSKRHRVEAMYYMYKKNDSANFLIEDSNKKNDYLAPALFYYGKWKFIVGISKKYTASDARRYYNDEPEETKPKYIVFWQTENIDERIDSVKKSFPNLKYETTIEASFLDKTLHWLNPLNDNQTSYIYRIEN